MDRMYGGLGGPPCYMHLQEFIHIDIHFATDAKALQINARFDCEETPGQNPPFFMHFQVVQMGPVAMDLGSQAVSRAMQKIVAEAGLFNHVPHRMIHFPPLQGELLRESLVHQCDSRVSGGGDGHWITPIFGRSVMVTVLSNGVSAASYCDGWSVKPMTGTTFCFAPP